MKRISGIISKNTAVKEQFIAYEEEMMLKGWLFHSHLNLHCIQRFLAIEDDGKIISFLAYEKYDTPKNLRIIGAWTHPDYRRRHLYKSLFEELVESHKKFRRITSGFHKDNIISKQMQLARGSKPVLENEYAVRTVFDIQENCL